MEEYEQRTQMLLFPVKVNRVQNSGIMKRILIKFKLNLCIVVKNIVKIDFN